MNAVGFLNSFDACVNHTAHAVKYEIWWKGEVIDEFDNEQTAKDAVKDYAMAFKNPSSAFTIKKVTR